MNDDNLAFVRLSKKIASKINITLKSPSLLNLPTLVTGTLPRLKGFDGQRMSKSSKNYIGIFCSKDTLNQALTALVNADTALNKLVTAANTAGVMTFTSKVDGVNPIAVATNDANTTMTLTTIDGNNATTVGVAGTTAVDSIDGGAGNDFIVSGGGADTITTGAGADTGRRRRAFPWRSPRSCRG